MIEAKIGLTIDTDDEELLWATLDEVRQDIANRYYGSEVFPVVDVWWQSGDIGEV